METNQTWQILVPHKYNNKKTIHVTYHREWDEKVRNISGGLTIMRVVKGQWISPRTGKLHKELMIPVIITCSEDKILEIMKMTAEHYDQEAVHCSLVSEKTIIYHKET